MDEDLKQELLEEISFIHQRIDALCKFFNVSMQYDFVRERWEIVEREKEDEL